MYESTLIAQVMIFGLLLFTQERLLALLLLVPAILYLFATEYFLGLGREVYLTQGFIDISTAYCILYATKNYIQPLILLLFTVCNIAGYIEYPTSSYLIYNAYSSVTIGLNILQILVMWKAINDGVGLINSYFARDKLSLDHLQTDSRLPKAKE